jgi:alkanesulfonate monooxygenase SsuD/methylene tetrahydromethanopterin reductase-like flavin-dependent oxidoreductase (luciferase family)
LQTIEEGDFVNIGIGLPAMIPGVDRDSLLTWARRGEERGFSTLGALDRLVYPNFEPLAALAASAAVTERIRLTTDILIAPLRGNGAVLAKQAATIDALSNGRLTLGIGVGLRDDDFKVAGVPFEERGRLFDQQLDEMRKTWAGEERGFAGAVGPPPAREGGPELVIGGSVDATVERVVRFGDGWTMGGGTPEAFREMSSRVKEAWSEGGRDGTPRLIALCYFALGEGAAEAAEEDLGHYYGWLGDEIAGQIVASAVTDEGTAQGYRDAFADAGADELIYFPTSTDPAQVDLLADALL